MLLDIVNATQLQINAYTQLQKQLNQLQDIKNTKDQLDILQRDCNRILLAYELLHPHLDDMKRLSVSSNIDAINIRLRSSQSDFESDKYKQAPVLGQINSSIKSLHNTLAQFWLIYAQGQIGPYEELKRIAQTLPQMHQRNLNLENLIRELNSATKNLPTMPSWAKFHANLEQVATLLEDIKGLSHEKRSFLDAIQTGNATLNDITPELLEWCIEVGLGNSLVLRFKHGN